MPSIVSNPAGAPTPARPYLRVSMAFAALALALLPFADIEVSTIDPWRELARMAWGVVTPDFFATEELGSALLLTVAFAVLGVAAGSISGFGLALVFRFRAVRAFCAVIRAVHELFWALIFLQIFGLSPLTGLLAIAIPYAGTFAKVYSEILEEADPAPLKALPAGTHPVSAFFYARLPDAWVHFKSYSLYRLECGLRSSAVLGFVGLPTVGYHLESAFGEGKYSEVAALLLLFYLVIVTIRHWVHAKLMPLYVLAALFAIPWGGEINATYIARFFTSDIVPHPLRVAETLDAGAWIAAWDWLVALLAHQALPGLVSTILLTQIALVGTGLCTLAVFPLISSRFFDRLGRTAGHVLLVVVRSTPEYVLASVFLLLWGPSMLPAILALALHNGAIIGHLIGRHSETLALRPDRPRGLNLYFYEVLPRVYPQFLAFLFYRWEVIMRETAILGMLGIATLGFYVDSAFQTLRFDRALVLIVVTALLNVGVDVLSRHLRGRLRLTTRMHELGTSS